MTPIQLECFFEVIRQGTFSLAASNLYMSQSSLSRHISALEEELHAELFVRANNTVRLSPVGVQLRPKLEEMRTIFSGMSADIRRIVDSQRDSLKIGVQDSLQLEPQMRRGLKQLLCKNPHANIQLYHMRLNDMFDALMNGMVDLVLCLDISMPASDKFFSRVLRSEPICLAVPADHPNAELLRIDDKSIPLFFPDLELYVLDLDGLDLPIRTSLRSALPKSQIIRTNYFSGRWASLDSLLMMVDAGVGMTLVNESSILKNNSHIRLIPLAAGQDNRIFPQTTSIMLYWSINNPSFLLAEYLQELK